LARWLGVQSAVGYRSEERFDLPVVPDAELHVRTVPITASGKLYIPLSDRFEPYGVLGAGWYRVFFDYSETLEAVGFRDTDTTTFGWHLGAGGSLHFNRSVGAFLEGRWAFYDPEDKLDDATVERIKGLDFDTVNVLAGLNFAF
jgi:opacity protein-like surface antigen